MKKIIAIIGARPQFIKHCSFENSAKGKFHLKTIHTGQHYDSNMSEIFFKELKMKPPDYLLQNGGGTHGYQTGNMMIDIEEILIKERPDAIIVYGDTNSTLAGALVGSKLCIPVYHIEAGLRSYNTQMPEEINRIVTDHVSSILFSTSKISFRNLQKEGLSNKTVLVGDLMKDLVFTVVNNLDKNKINYNYSFYYVTIHRHYNTDSKKRLIDILYHLNLLNKKVIFSLHPRTRKLIEDCKIDYKSYDNIEFIDPQNYYSNINLIIKSDGVITDSGGIQKEAYWLKKTCVTIRPETEWTETLLYGWNKLLFHELNEIEIQLLSKPKRWDKNLYGDGKAADKIVNFILKC